MPKLPGATDTGRFVVGCSGWNYRDWRGRVYPVEVPMTRWLEHYMTLFDSVELNTTFYRLPSVTTVQNWAARARPGFVFAMKLGAFGSHRMKLRDAASWLPNHIERATPLGEHLGPTVVQLPPRWKRNTERLDEFLTVAPAHMRWVVEIRDPTWLHDDTYAVLRRHGAALCVHDLIAEHPVMLTADFTYLRFHGPDAINHPYRFRYGPERIAPWAERIAAWNAAGVDVYAYFNNDWEAHAIADANTLRAEVDTLSRAPVTLGRSAPRAATAPALPRPDRVTSGRRRS